MEKNIWLVPTDKPSILHTWVNNKGLRATLYEQPQIEVPNTAKNLYITNEEEIKEGDWYIDYSIERLVEVHKLKIKFSSKPNNCKKIILTTDQDLIKEGIQEIPYSLLEWFVKNPSCESIKVKTWIKTFEDGSTFDRMDYELIIPQDQPKQTIEEVAYKYAEIYRCPATNEDEYCAHDIISAINFGYNHAQTEIEELRNCKWELLNELLSVYNKIDKGTDSYKRIEQLITKHK